MKIVAYSAKPYDKQVLCREFHHQWESLYLEVPLDLNTIAYAKDAEVISAFVNDRLDAKTLKLLAEGGTKLIALRCAGFNHVDLEAAKSLGIKVVRVPAYSPYAVAEHTVALMLGFKPQAVSSV